MKDKNTPMNLYAQIMSLPVQLPSDLDSMSVAMAYIAGYRDARHAAAELASTQEVTVELPDDGELEAWRSASENLFFLLEETPGREIRRAALLLQNAYLFATKMRKLANRKQGKAA